MVLHGRARAFRFPLTSDYWLFWPYVKIIMLLMIPCCQYSLLYHETFYDFNFFSCARIQFSALEFGGWAQSFLKGRRCALVSKSQLAAAVPFQARDFCSTSVKPWPAVTRNGFDFQRLLIHQLQRPPCWKPGSRAKCLLQLAEVGCVWESLLTWCFLLPLQFLAPFLPLSEW